MTASRCFIFMYFLLLHWKSAIWSSRAQTCIREVDHHTGWATNLQVQPLNHIIGTDSSPVFTGKITVSQRLLNAILHFLGGLFQLHETQLFHYGFSFFSSSILALLGVDCLEHFGSQLHLGARRGSAHIAIKVDGAALVFCLGEHFSHGLQHTKETYLQQ